MLMLAASPTTAAERTVSSLLTPDGEARPGGKVSVVRVDRRTGKLVRTIDGGTAPAAVKVTPPPAHIQKMVENSAREYDIDPLLVQSVIQVESNYNHYAVSPKGAEGLMQLMPGTARQLGVGNSFDPAQNIEAGVKYLKYLQGVYGDDRLALAAYNAGPKAVDKYKSVPPYSETQDYVEQVGRRYQAAKRNEAEQAAALATAEADAVTADAVATTEKYPRLEQSLDDHGRLVLRTAQE
jgi:soluble lytic murein transglycosylase-like protein